MDPAAMLQVAYQEARKGLAEGGVPIGAALFSADGVLLGSGHNRRVQHDDRRCMPRPTRSGRLDGGLQVYSDADGWSDAPYDPNALTVNIGDLLEYWSGRRWPSGRHRVLPPQPHAPEEDLVSLIYFYEANHDAVVTPLSPPIGRVSGLEPVTSSAFIKERLDAITVG